MQLLDGISAICRRLSKEEWQVAYDEYYLNETGDITIVDFFKKPEKNSSPTRLTFFFYFVDFTTPLSTPYGKVDLPSPSLMPKRLKDIIDFEEVD